MSVSKSSLMVWIKSVWLKRVTNIKRGIEDVY